MTNAIVRSANLGTGLFFLLFGVQMALTWHGVTDFDLRRTNVAGPAGDWATVVDTFPYLTFTYLLFAVVYYFASVRRTVVITELAALAYGYSVGVILALPLFVWTIEDRHRPSTWDTYYFAVNLVGTATMILIGGHHVLAAYRFRRLRRELRRVGVDLSIRPWNRPTFRAQMRIVSRPLVVLAMALFLLGAIAFQGLVLGMVAESWWVAAPIGGASIVVCFGLLIAGHRVLRHAYRRAMRGLGEAMTGDQRPPVLFLRSFRDDHVRAKPRRKPVLWPLARQRLGSEGSFEEVLTIALADIGPVIAIGRPGEKHRPVGAAREYLRDETWQARVDTLIREAALVVILIGDTEGLAWEAERLMTPAVRNRVIFVVPPVKDAEANRRWAAMRRYVAATQEDPIALPDAMTGVLAFSVGGEDGRAARAYVAKDRTLEQYELAIMVASHERLRGPLPEKLLRRFAG